MKCKNCHHEVKRNSFGTLWHCRKECEYSDVCWRCECKLPTTDELEKEGHDE